MPWPRRFSVNVKSIYRWRWRCKQQLQPDISDPHLLESIGLEAQVPVCECARCQCEGWWHPNTKHMLRWELKGLRRWHSELFSKILRIVYFVGDFHIATTRLYRNEKLLKNWFSDDDGNALDLFLCVCAALASQIKKRIEVCFYYIGKEDDDGGREYGFGVLVQTEKNHSTKIDSIIGPN